MPLACVPGLLCDLLWSDPDKDVQGWGENDRGVSFTFGADVVSKFLNRHDLDLICRAHQVSSDGERWAYECHVVTLHCDLYNMQFSAAQKYVVFLSLQVNMCQSNFLLFYLGCSLVSQNCIK